MDGKHIPDSDYKPFKGLASRDCTFLILRFLWYFFLYFLTSIVRTLSLANKKSCEKIIGSGNKTAKSIAKLLALLVGLKKFWETFCVNVTARMMKS